MSEREPVAMTSEFEGALRHDVFYLGCGLDGDDCMRLFNEIDALRARVDELTRERDEARDEIAACVRVVQTEMPKLTASTKEDLDRLAAVVMAKISEFSRALAASEARVKVLEARESALRDAFNASVDAGALHGERSSEARLARAHVEKAMAAIVCATPLSAPSGEVTK